MIEYKKMRLERIPKFLTNLLGRVHEATSKTYEMLIEEALTTELKYAEREEDEGPMELTLPKNFQFKLMVGPVVDIDVKLTEKAQKSLERLAFLTCKEQEDVLEDSLITIVSLYKAHMPESL